MQVHLLVLPLTDRRAATNQLGTHLAFGAGYRLGFFGGFGIFVVGGGISSTLFMSALGLMPRTWQSRK